jgi:hypothetical protein
VIPDSVHPVAESPGRPSGTAKKEKPMPVFALMVENFSVALVACERSAAREERSKRR